MPILRLIGPGRAGTSLAAALAQVGWSVASPVRHGDDPAEAALGVDLLVISTPDDAIAGVAAAVRPEASTVVVHLAGSLGPDVLAPHVRRGALHPLASLPDAEVGAARLAGGCWFAVAGDPLVADLVAALGGTAVDVADEDRPAYHAAAAIASNHLVALLGQVERVGATAGVPLDAYLDLVRGTVANVAAMGPDAALTGPAARGDRATVERHLAALAPEERPAYDALSRLAARRRPAGEMPAPRAAGARVAARIGELRSLLEAERDRGATVGLVPTMGALHDGHAALIALAADECDVVVVSVFVNPLQFGPDEDLAAYPRDLDADVVVAEKAGATVVFAPSVDEMYPTAPVTSVQVGGPACRLEGDRRPGHFAGVATVVTKLVHAVGPCRAYFGEKDWQQLLVVRRLVDDLSLPAEVVACPTVREGDGLALSSRNAYLSTPEREAAPVLHRALRAGAATIKAGERDVDAVRSLITAIVEAEPLVSVDYVEVARAIDLTPASAIAGELRLLLAARVGKTRLIDNIGVNL